MTSRQLPLYFQPVDAPVAKAVKKPIQRHLWYLTEPLIVLGLFDSHLGCDMKAAMAVQLQTSLKPPVYTPGKPTFPRTAVLLGDTSLTSLVGTHSWLLFDLLGETGHWLALPPGHWDKDDDFAIWDSLVDDYLPVPKPADWQEIAQGIRERWNFPNCVGAMDGKHILIQAPLVDVGAFGRSSDGGTLAASAFGEALREEKLGLPEDAPLPGADHLGSLPHVFVGDEAFPLRRNLLRPYPGRHLSQPKSIFNYRLSRARRVVENAFGIFAAQWRIDHRVIGVCPENVDAIVKATVALHNFQRWNNTTEAPVPADDQPIPAFRDVRRMGANNSAQQATAVREAFCSYFSSPAGEVPLQNT
ncbi:protein ALP1-like [Thalassophryne amazonica]|uniref:protein ALP1-like n=1 Tax=Thalassophryne amazonica TaxID=390379 RepID=UPI0014725C4D|nr:protein ALP1-like [Thalassophryne amazonica]